MNRMFQTARSVTLRQRCFSVWAWTIPQEYGDTFPSLRLSWCGTVLEQRKYETSMFIIAVCFVRYWKETPRSLRLKEQRYPFQSKAWRKTYWTVRMCCNMLLFEGINVMLLNRQRNAIKTLCFPHLAVYESKWLSASFHFNEKVTWCSCFWNLMEPRIGLENNKAIWPFAVPPSIRT